MTLGTRLTQTVVSWIAVTCGGLAAQERPVAIQNARVLTMTGETLESATVLLRGGSIEAVGADVEIPAGAEIVDAQGGTLMPGLVSAYSRAGVTAPPQQDTSEPAERRGRFRGRGRGGSGSSAASNKAAAKVSDALYARQDVFGDLLECGVTTLAVTPEGPGFPGQGAVLDPAGKTREALTVDDEAFVLLSAATGTKNKELIKDGLEKAQKAVEERKKPKTPEKPAEEKKPEAKKTEAKAPEAEGKTGEKPPAKEGEKPPVKEGEKKEGDEKSEEKKPQPPQPARPAKKDPNIEVLADVLEGKRRAFLLVTSASDLAHFKGAIGKSEFPKRTLIAPGYSSTNGRLDEVLDQLEPFKGTILTSPTLTSPAYSEALVNPAAALVAAGYDVGFILGDSKRDVRDLFFKLMELVRHGLDRDAALAGVTLVPAKALGIDDRVGSIAEGKDADLLLFDRDPLDPAAKLVRVWHKGGTVGKERTE